MVANKTTLQIIEKFRGTMEEGLKKWVSLDELQKDMNVKLGMMIYDANTDFANNSWSEDYFKGYQQAIYDVIERFFTPLNKKSR